MYGGVGTDAVSGGDPDGVSDNAAVRCGGQNSASGIISVLLLFSIDDAYFKLAYVTHQGDDGKTYNSIMEAKEEYGSICADTVEALRNRELKMAVPFIDGRRMETEGQDPIIFMTKELF